MWTQKPAKANAIRRELFVKHQEGPSSRPPFFAGGIAMQEYGSDKLVVRYDPAICIHAGECVRGLPSVFNLSKKPWIDVNGASAAAVMIAMTRPRRTSTEAIRAGPPRPTATRPAEGIDGTSRCIVRRISWRNDNSMGINPGSKKGLEPCGPPQSARCRPQKRRCERLAVPMNPSGSWWEPTWLLSPTGLMSAMGHWRTSRHRSVSVRLVP